MTELKVGGLQRSIIIPAGKLQQGWRDFVIELRRMLEPSHYALGGLKFVLFIGKFQSFVLVNVFPPPPAPRFLSPVLSLICLWWLAQPPL